MDQAGLKGLWQTPPIQTKDIFFKALSILTVHTIFESLHTPIDEITFGSMGLGTGIGAVGSHCDLASNHTQGPRPHQAKSGNSKPLFIIAKGRGIKGLLSMLPVSSKKLTVRKTLQVFIVVVFGL